MNELRRMEQALEEKVAKLKAEGVHHAGQGQADDVRARVPRAAVEGNGAEEVKAPEMPSGWEQFAAEAPERTGWRPLLFDPALGPPALRVWFADGLWHVEVADPFIGADSGSPEEILQFVRCAIGAK